MKIKNELNNLGITYKEAAKILGVHAKYFNTIVNGARPGPMLAKKIELEFGIPKSKLRPDIWTR